MTAILILVDLSIPSARIGPVRRHPSADYHIGDEVTAEFWGGHPRNDFLVQSTFLEVQRREGDQWATIARDWDPETRFLWDRRFVFRSLITVRWPCRQARYLGCIGSCIGATVNAYSAVFDHMKRSRGSLGLSELSTLKRLSAMERFAEMRYPGKIDREPQGIQCEKSSDFLRRVVW